MKQVDVLIIGAGAAGLMCAICAGKRGRQVLVCDHANKAGKKILMSGGGHCNFTNLKVESHHFISGNPNFCKSALSRYTPRDFIALVEAHDIPYHEKTRGQLFCDRKSKEILAMLLKECKAVAADIQLETKIDKVARSPAGGFLVSTSKGRIQCESLVIATGGLSIPTMGASPFGYRIAEQFSLPVRPTRAGLVPFTLQADDKQKYASLSGISSYCEASTHRMLFSEDMLFTHRGLSGPAMLQISSYWQPGENLSINLLPQHNLEQLLQQGKAQHPNMQLKTFLQQWFSKRHIAAWLDDRYKQCTIQQLSAEKIKHVAALFHQWSIKPNGTEGYRTAEVTLGGVDCDAISSKTFAAYNVPGLYFIGEVLDVTGWLGGYNFQWAWSSGATAGWVV